MLTLMQTYTQLCINAFDRLLVSRQTPLTTVSPVIQHLSKPNKGHPFSLAPVTFVLVYTAMFNPCTHGKINPYGHFLSIVAVMGCSSPGLGLESDSSRYSQDSGLDSGLAR